MKVKLLGARNLLNSQSRSFFDFFRNTDDVTKLIKSSGYKGERHQVKTRDGYHLTVHRILPNKNAEPKGTVFLMHGLFRNSADYIATGPKIALPYLLSDNGFDCFLGNARGAKYSTKHDNHSYDSKEFWKFSWEEIGLNDLPAMIEFTIDKTGSTKVSYVGHSQGGTTVLALLASKPEYNELLSQMHLMAPAVFMNGSTSIAFNFVNRLLFKKLSKRFHKFNITTMLKLVNTLSEYKDKDPETLMKLYKTVTCSFVGRNKGEVQLSLEALKTFNQFMSPAVSSLQLKHFLQLYQSGQFHRFDHEERNSEIYGSPSPPEYKLSNIVVPTYLYHAEEDTLVVKTGMDRLACELPNVQNYQIVPDFNHIDLMLGKDAREMLYNDILRFLMLQSINT